ncbi:MAG: FtsX-like permease family protein [Candidatus Thorarchaeota archaeon]
MKRETSWTRKGNGLYRYTLKRTFRNWKLFLAILTGILIGTTLFASANLGSTAILSALLDETLESAPIDILYYPNLDDVHGFPNSTNLARYQNTIEVVDGILNTEVVIHYFSYNYTTEREIGNYFAGISANSPVYDGLESMTGATSLGINETFIVARSDSRQDYPVGRNFTIQIEVERYLELPVLVNLTLTVVGIVEMTDAALSYMLGEGYYDWPWLEQNFFVVDLEQTFFPIVDSIDSFTDFQWMNINPKIYIFLDRARIINPFDITSSIQRINQIGQQLQNLLGIDAWVEIRISMYLIIFSSMAEGQKLTFLMMSMPVFFIAIYMGITLNDVSFSLRRREVGLYLTKGLTRGQITGMFVTEGLLTGFLASLIGLGLGFVLVPYFVGTGIYVPLNPFLVGFDTIFLTFIFGISLAMITTYFPARKAVQMPTTETLREYTITGEPTGYRKILVWTCFVLGTYKLIIWISGLNISNLIRDIIVTNPIIAYVFVIWLYLDMILAFWAPLLFFYGLTMLLIKGSTRFHDYATRFIRRIMGDLGAIAAHTIRRRPGRTAAVIFITALLVGYSIQTIGVVASQQDLVVRQIYAQTGADLRVDVRYTDNATNLLEAIREIPGVQGATNEFTFEMSTAAFGITVRAINVSEWVNVAYWEPEWFGMIQPAHLALQALTEDNETIILERVIGVRLNLGLGDGLSVSFPIIGLQRFTVCGYFGPEPVNLGSGYYSYWEAEPTWSYISQEGFLRIEPYMSYTGYILVSLTSAAVNDDVVNAIRAVDDVASVDSALETIGEYRTNVFLNSNTNMMQMGLLFAFLLGSLGTIVIVYLTLRERRVSTALMSARGMTYPQTVRILMAETMTMIGFAIIVGLIVGNIVLYGLVRGGTGATSFFTYPQLVIARFLPAPYIAPIVLQTGAFLGLLLLASIIPIVTEAYFARYDMSVLR